MTTLQALWIHPSGCFSTCYYTIETLWRCLFSTHSHPWASNTSILSYITVSHSCTQIGLWHPICGNITGQEIPVLYFAAFLHLLNLNRIDDKKIDKRRWCKASATVHGTHALLTKMCAVLSASPLASEWCQLSLLKEDRWRLPAVNLCWGCHRGGGAEGI